jgi:hypothetical protein
MHVFVDLTDPQLDQLLKNSIERVVNTSISIIETTPSDEPDLIETNLLDWKALKPIVVALWSAAQAARRQDLQPAPPIMVDADTTKIRTVQLMGMVHHAFEVNGELYVSPKPIGRVGDCIRP